MGNFIVPIGDYVSVKQVGSNLMQSGLEITIPARCPFVLLCTANYTKSRPLEVGVSEQDSSDSLIAHNSVELNTSYRCSVTYSGYYTEDKTFKAWGRWYTPNSTNYIEFRGFYINLPK